MNHKTDPKIEEIIKRFDKFVHKTTRDGEGYDEILDYLRSTLTDFAQSVREEEREYVLRRVEEILPYSAGFTGRFYALESELNPDKKIGLSKEQKCKE